jgi:dolichol-phosphate mannosyltransferase
VIVRFARFGTVGASGSLLNLALFCLFTSGLGLHHALAGIAAFELSMCSNYALNQRWTFADRSAAPGGLLRYQLASLGALAISLAILNLAVALGVPPLIANAFGIATASVWSFSLSLGWTWRTAPSPAFNAA